MSEELELTMSPLCQSISCEGKSVQIDIYKGHGEGWTLEVVDEFNNSTVWEDLFDTDANALKEAMDTIKNEGIDALIGNLSETTH